MASRWLPAVLLLAGCHIVLGLEDVPDQPPRPPPGRWAQVAVGDGHICAIDLDGALWCWGTNASGQLGLGATGDVLEPTQVGADRWLQISTAIATTCGVRADQTLWCWGANGTGQVGTGDTLNVFTPYQLAGTWNHVSAGSTHTCAIDSDAAAHCWGTGTEGQLGNNVYATATTPQPVMSTEAWLAIRAGEAVTCALAKDRRAWCWGRGYAGGLGNGTTTGRGTPGLVDSRTWQMLDIGRSHSCALREDSVLSCWGANSSGQLGDPAVSQVENPNPVLDSAAVFRLVGTGADHTCAAKTDGTLWCWGSNSDNQTSASGAAATNPVPVQVRLEKTEWIQIDGGARATCAIAADHNMWCWGADVGSFGDQTVLVPSQLPGTWKKVAAGGQTTCAIATDDSLACWGFNTRGTVGDGSRIHRFEPVTIAQGAWRELDLGETLACALDASGTAWCWGFHYGGIGDGATSRVEPTPIMGNYSALSVGSVVLALDASTGALWCWGQYYSGLCGTGVQAEHIPMPTQIGASTWSSVGTGNSHSCGVTNGAIYCWGYNYSAQLGDGTTTTRYTPSPVYPTTGLTTGVPTAGGTFTLALEGSTLFGWGANYTGELGGISANYYVYTPTAFPGSWRAVAAGTSHACAIATDNTLWCWGSNARGQVGNGELSNVAVERTQIDPQPVWDQVAAAVGHTCALRLDGTLWCWGANQYGQLGLGGGAADAEPRLVE